MHHKFRTGAFCPGTKEGDISHNNKTKYQFSCLSAVQHWYDGDTTGQNENYGIMLCYQDPEIADYNSFYSADCTDANSRPALTINYTPMDRSVDEGKTLALSVSGATGTVTWTSSNTSVATVNSNGVVTGIKAGIVTITAYVDGNVFETFTVYVTIVDGVYYIKNTYFEKYLSTTGGVAEQTWATLKNKAASGLSQLQQLWKIVYLGNGYYSIRPMYALSMALHATSNTVDIVTVGTIDSLTVVPLVSRWGIEAVSGEYTFMHVGTGSLKMGSYKSYSEYYITTENYASGATASYWTLEEVSSVPTQVLLLDTQTGTSAANRTVYLEPGQTMTLSDLQMKASVVCMNSLSQYITWSSDSDSVSVDSTTGAITAITPGGSAILFAKHIRNGAAYEARYYVSIGAVVGGTYYICSGAHNRYMQIDDEDEPNDYTSHGAYIEQWDFDGGDYQKWLLQWCGGGYYSIISAESGDALTVPSGQSLGDGIALVQQPYIGSDSQKWMITIMDGRYKIKAKSAEASSDDLVMAVASEMNSDGIGIVQKKYVDDSSYVDEWEMFMVGEYGYKLLAFNDNFNPRNEFFTDVESIVSENLPSKVYMRYYTTIEKGYLKQFLSDSDIFIVHTHGRKEGIYVSSTDYLSMDDLKDTDLSGLGFALLLTCNTASDFSINHISNNQPVNIVEQMVCCGAETVIGFSTITTVSDCNLFAPAFIEQTVYYGRSVREAMYSIDYSEYDIDMYSSSRIGGNDEKCLND